MSKIELPVIKEKQVVFPGEPLCPWCGEQKVYEPPSMAILNGGALQPVGNESYTMAAETVAFLSLLWHGTHSGGVGQDPEISASVDLVDKAGNGQFDLYFCSTGCLK